MNISSVKQFLARHNPRPRRAVLPALLLVALAMAVLVGSALAAQNHIFNGSFEQGNGSSAAGWSDSGLTSSDGRVCNKSYVGSCSFKFVSDGSYKTLFQYYSVSGNQGDTYALSLWTKVKDVTIGSGTFIYSMRFHHSDGDGEADGFDGGLTSATFPWIRFHGSDTASDAFDFITVTIIFDPDAGKAWFDKVKLVGP